MRKEILKFLRDSLVEIIGGLIVAAALSRALFVNVGAWPLLGIAAGIVWLICLYIRLRMKEAEELQIFEKGHGSFRQISIPFYHPRLRRWALIVMIILPIAAGITAGYLVYEDRAYPRSHTTILVADFLGPDPERYAVTETIIEELNTAVNGVPGITIKALGSPISAQEGSLTARNIAQEHKATAIIWGWYGVTDDSVIIYSHFDAAHPESSLVNIEMDRQIGNIELLSSFELQIELAEQFSFFAFLTAGMSALHEASRYSLLVITRDISLTPEQEADVQRWNAQANIFLDRALEYSGSVSEPFLVYFAYYLSGVTTLNVIESECGDAPQTCATQQYASALAKLNKAYELSPDYETKVQVLFVRGVALTLSGDYLQAADDYTEAISILYSLEPSATLVYLLHYFRGEIYYEIDEHAKAIADFTKSLEFPNNDPRAYPNVAHIYRLRGHSHLLNGQCELAIDDLTQAASLYSKWDDSTRNSEGEDSNLVSSLRTRSLAYEDIGEYELAEADLLVLTEMDPTDSWYWTELGALEFKQARFEEALDRLDHALSLVPDSVQALYSKGVVYLATEEYKTAASAFNESLAIDPEHVESLKGRAIANFRLNKQANALRDYDSVIRIAPDRTLPVLTVGYDGSCASGQGTAILLDVSFVGFLLENDRDAPVIDVLTVAIAATPTDSPEMVEYLFLRGLGYIALGRYQDAIADLSEVIEVEESHSEARYFRAGAYSALNDHSHALSDYKRVLVLSPDFAERAFIEEQISVLQEELERLP